MKTLRQAAIELIQIAETIRDKSQPSDEQISLPEYPKYVECYEELKLCVEQLTIDNENSN